VEDAAVTCTLGECEVFLADADGEVVRLRWARDDERRERVLPAGAYKLKGYRIVRGEWMISTAAGQQTVQLEPNEVTELEIDAEIRVKLTSRVEHAGIQLQMVIQGRSSMGFSIYRNGRRIPIGYALKDAKGETLASGTMRYG